MKPRSIYIITAYLVLLIFAVPWYWPETNTQQLAGVPLWVVTVLFVAFCASVLTAWNLLASDPDNSSEDDPD